MVRWGRGAPPPPRPGGGGGGGGAGAAGHRGATSRAPHPQPRPTRGRGGIRGTVPPNLAPMWETPPRPAPPAPAATRSRQIDGPIVPVDRVDADHSLASIEQWAQNPARPPVFKFADGNP